LSSASTTLANDNAQIQPMHIEACEECSDE